MVRHALSRFILSPARDNRGAVALIFAVLAAPLVMLTGSALDYSAASSARSQMQAATDVAALSGASVEPWSEAACRDRVETVFAGLVTEMPRLDQPELDILCGGNTVTVSADTRMQTTLMSVVGFRDLALGAYSEIACSSASGEEDGEFIGWDTGGDPDRTRVIALSRELFGHTLYYQTSDGYPVIRLDNPHDGPATITVNAVPGGEQSYDLPHRGKFHVPFPYSPAGAEIVFTIVDGPEPFGPATATWGSPWTLSYAPQGEPFHADVDDEPRRCFIAS
ncbi:MAG: pilus assembly protein [Oceanicaulis sp.]|nr:pilus assembly protein [Oceanicaulis sp.]